MTLRPIQIDELERMYLTMTTSQMAERWGIRPDLMRKILSDHGISDPKAKEKKMKRELLIRFWGKGEPETIAEYLGLSMPALRMRVRRMGLPTGQQAIHFETQQAA